MNVLSEPQESVPKGAWAAASRRRQKIIDAFFSLARSERWLRGHHLTEDVLSKRLGISRSPLRAALQQLSQNGWVQTIPNKGSFLLVDSEHLPDGRSTDDPSFYAAVYQRLIKDRMLGSIPETFSVTQVARFYDISRPVAESVLQTLSNDGLVERNRGQGWRFLPSYQSTEARYSCYDFRLSTEPSCFFLASFSVDYEKLDTIERQHLDLQQALSSGIATNNQIFSCDTEFHLTIAEFSSNVFFINSITQINRMRHLFEYATYDDTSRVDDWCQEHLRIMQAIKVKDLSTASQLMRAHLTNAQQYDQH